MVTEHDMSDAMGLMIYERSRPPKKLPASFSTGKAYSEGNAAQIDDEVARFVVEAHQRVRKILSERRTVLADLAQPLSRQESVQGDELRKMLSSAAPSLTT